MKRTEDGAVMPSLPRLKYALGVARLGVTVLVMAVGTWSSAWAQNYLLVGNPSDNSIKSFHGPLLSRIS
jgi:hypothetical protein